MLRVQGTKATDCLASGFSQNTPACKKFFPLPLAIS
jgi:hypothetical protein